MAKVLVTEANLVNIANAIRGKLGNNTPYRPGDMAAAIQGINSGYPEPTGTVNITQNGTVNVKDYASASVNVPNSYAVGDEGKVVRNGALAAQTSRTVTSNGTYDTTDNNEVVVNVSGGGGGGSNGIYVGTTDPTADIGSNGDYYYKRVRGAMNQGCVETMSNSSSQVQAGYEFNVLTTCYAAGLCGLLGASGNVNLYLCTSAGTILAEIDNVFIDEINTWKTFMLDNPVTLQANTNYVVLIRRQGSSGMKYTSGSHVTDNRIRYIYGRYGTSFPGNYENGIRYSADIVLKDINDNVYRVTSQFYKENGIWSQL